MHFCQVSEQYKGVNFVERHEKNWTFWMKCGASGNSGGTRHTHLDKLFCGEVELETNSAALGLACTPSHSNTFFKRGWPRYFSFIAVFRKAGAAQTR